MTIERPMFPPVEQSNVVQFSAAKLSAKRLDEMPTGPIFVRRREHPLPEPLTESCRNHRLRLSRRDAWNAARQLTNYWRARHDWQTALSIAQEYNVADSHKFPSADGEERFRFLDLWRTALVKQMLTPAPDVAAVNWKRAQLRAENYVYTDAKPERLQRAIDADVEWLEAHPSRKSVAASRQAAMARRREFKEG
jgi:hypothetical protein